MPPSSRSVRSSSRVASSTMRIQRVTSRAYACDTSRSSESRVSGRCEQYHWPFSLFLSSYERLRLSSLVARQGLRYFFFTTYMLKWTKLPGIDRVDYSLQVLAHGPRNNSSCITRGIGTGPPDVCLMTSRCAGGRSPSSCSNAWLSTLCTGLWLLTSTQMAVEPEGS